MATAAISATNIIEMLKKRLGMEQDYAASERIQDGPLLKEDILTPQHMRKGYILLNSSTDYYNIKFGVKGQTHREVGRKVMDLPS